MSPDKPWIDYDGPQAFSVLSTSLSEWQARLHHAMLMSTLPENCYSLERLLCRVPRLPDDIPGSLTVIEGYSTWKSLDVSCPLKYKQEKLHKFRLRRQHPVKCTISASDNFQVWEGNPNNGLALLVLGWAYVLSASLAERQHLSLQYATLDHSSRSQGIKLDYASPKEIRWWKAITAQGSGFTIAADKCYSPWAVQVDCHDLAVAGEIDGIQSPPSAKEAVHYLARFSDNYYLGSQCSAALTAALSLPLHGSVNFRGLATVELPRPSLKHCPMSHQNSRFLTDPKLLDPRLLDRYMTLSLTPAYFGSTLWSVFAKPDIPCNYVGAWLGPISSVLRPIIQDNDLELLVKVFSFTSASPLWVGVALCGQRAIIKSIIPFLESLIPYSHTHPFIDAAAWTGIPQSFMDNHPPGPYLHDGKVSRANIWRLRHDLHANYYPDDSFSLTPPHGWPPFGTMQFEDIELELHDHLYCSHQWKYEFWTWTHSSVTDSGIMENGAGSSLPLELFDSQRTEMKNRRIMQSMINFKVSEKATERIFKWCSSQVEKGFGGSIVARNEFDSPIDDEAESDKPIDHDALHSYVIKWRRASNKRRR